MNITSKLAVLAVCCAGAIGMTQPAKADSFSIGYHGGGWGGWHHSGYSVSLGVGGPYYGGGYYYGGPVYYNGPRCFYDYYGYYHCRPYGYGGYYGPAWGVSYYGGWGHPYRGGWYGHGWYGNGGWHGNHGWKGNHGGHGWSNVGQHAAGNLTHH